MGMFDEIKCKYPLPVKKVQDEIFQTKDTPSQFMDDYEIRTDGTLWHQTYNIVDKSDKNAKGPMRLVGTMTRVNKRWKRDKLTGEIVFYTTIKNVWYEFSAYFVGGKIKELHQINPKKVNKNETR